MSNMPVKAIKGNQPKETLKVRKKGNILSSDELFPIHSNFKILNFKSQIRMSNLVEFNHLDQIQPQIL